MPGTAAVGVALFSTVNTCRHFIAFQNDDLGDFSEALQRIDPRSKVAALIYDRGSSVTHEMFSPFLHFGSYAQAEKGGVVMFTYAGYAHWPFDFRAGHYPPPGGPARLRWEWTPEQVSPERELEPYYDYVLVRGGRFNPRGAQFERVFEGDRWEVWKNAKQPR